MNTTQPSSPGMRKLDKREQVQRRGFLRGSGLAAIGVAIIPAVGLAPSTTLAQTFPTLGETTGRTLLRMARDIYPTTNWQIAFTFRRLAHMKRPAQLMQLYANC